MKDNEYKEFITGNISGIVQTIVGHPLDTIKVLEQNKIDIKNNKDIFNGLMVPMLTNSLLTGIQFYSYEHYSWLTMGIISGLISTPIEYYKIQKQVNNNYDLKRMPRGYTITCLRETIALNCYFNTYDYLKNKTGIFFAGGLSGSLSWLITYPIDTIKSRVQANNISRKVNESVLTYNYNLYRDAYLKKELFRGLRFCLFRGFIVNGFGFLGAYYTQNYLKN